MDQQYICTILYLYMLETVESQAYDVIYMNSVLNYKIKLLKILYILYIA